MGRGTSTLIAGAAGALMLPALAFGAHLPLWLSIGAALGVFGGLQLALKPNGFGLRIGEMQEAQNETMQGLISDGADALDRMKRIAPQIKDPAMKDLLGKLVATATQLLAHLRADPERAMAVRRFLTFYLPNAAGIAEGWQTLERNANPAPERVAQAREVMKALGDAFQKFSSQADTPELEELDLNLKVVKDALKSDLEKTP